MGVRISGASADVGVGPEAASALHVAVKPIAALGHYRVNHRCALVTAQAANSRLFELRNPSSSVLVVPTRLILRAVQASAGTAQEASIDAYRLTGFTAVDTTNAVAIAPSPKRTGMSAPVAQLRGVTATGAAAGMTGGTLAKDSSSVGQMPMVIAAAAGTVVWFADLLDDVNGTHPFVLGLNEGLVIENRALNATSYGVTLYVDCSWAEAAAF